MGEGPSSKTSNGEQDCLRIEIRDLSSNIVFTSLVLPVHQHFHVCKSEIRWCMQKPLREDLMEVCCGKYFRREMTERKQVIENPSS